MKQIKIRGCAVCKKDFTEKEMMVITLPKKVEIGTLTMIIGNKTHILCSHCFQKLERYIEGTQ